MIEFGTLLRQFRNERGESLGTLSKKLGVGVSFLSLLENGKKIIPIEYGDKLTEVLGLNLDDSIKLKNSIDYTNRRISIDLDKMSDAQQEVSLTFARTINTASDKKLEEILKVLESDD